MPSKYGFGNSREVSPNKLATYGADNKSPIQQCRANTPKRSQKTRLALSTSYMTGSTGKKLTNLKGSNVSEFSNKLEVKPSLKLGSFAAVGAKLSRTDYSTGFMGISSDSKSKQTSAKKSKTFIGGGGAVNVLGSLGKKKGGSKVLPHLTLSGNYGKTSNKKGLGGDAQIKLGLGGRGSSVNVFAKRGIGNLKSEGTSIGAKANVGPFSVESSKNLKTGKTTTLGGLNFKF